MMIPPRAPEATLSWNKFHQPCFGREKTFWLPEPSRAGSKNFRRHRGGIRFSSQFSGRDPPSANIDPNLTRTRRVIRNWGLVLAHQPVTERKNEGAPNSFEPWDARSNSPPPKSAHNHLTSEAGVWEWLRSATGSFSFKSQSYRRKLMPIISGQMLAAHLSRPRRRGGRTG
jgi:hypothetical protein